MPSRRCPEEFEIPPLGVKDAADRVLHGVVAEHEVLSKLKGET